MKSETTALVVSSVDKDKKYQKKTPVLWKSLVVFFFMFLVTVIVTAISPAVVLMPTIIVFLFLLNGIVVLSRFVWMAFGEDDIDSGMSFVVAVIVLVVGLCFSHDIAYGVSYWIRDVVIATPHAFNVLYGVVCSFFHHIFFGSAR